MTTNEQLSKLRDVIAKNARVAFDQLRGRIGDEKLYGFAIFTDDSAIGLDAAANSLEALQRKLAVPRTNAFEAYWFTTEWEYEGGVAACFDPSCEIIESLAPDTNDEPGYDEFRRNVARCMIDAMEFLKLEGYFAQYAAPEKTVLQIAITDSDDDATFMKQSLQKLNPDSVLQKYIREAKEIGY